MKKIEDLRNSRCLYSERKITNDIFGPDHWLEIIWAGNEIILTKNMKGHEFPVDVKDDWYFYEEPKQTVLEPYLFVGTCHYKLLWISEEELVNAKTHLRGIDFIRKLTPEELASGKIVLEDSND